MPNTAKNADSATDTAMPNDNSTGPKLATLNQATIIGTETDAFEDLLDQEIEILAGRMFGANNRNNTQDGDWETSKMTLAQLARGFDKEGGAPAWGLSRHPIGKNKAGMCIVLGSSIGGARKAKAMKTMYLMGLDIDSGAKLADVVAILTDMGIACFVSTTHSHGKSGLALNRDVVLRKLGIRSDPTTEQVKEYLRTHDKSNFEESFIQQITIKTDQKLTKDGVVIELDTPPLDKFRLFFPLATPVNIIEQGNTHQEALDDWENAIRGLAAKLDVNFDTSCTDPSRLFYTARHPAGTDFECYIIQGEPLDYASIPRVTKAGGGNVFTQACGGDDWRNRPDVILDSGTNVSEWHRMAKDRFMMADLLKSYCADKIREAGGEKAGLVHTECPFEHEHTSEGGTGTFAVNCIDSPNEYWVWDCQHDACQGRHKTEFLGEALNRDWFDEELLMSDEFLLPYDGEGEDPANGMRDKKEAKVTRESAKTEATAAKITDGFGPDSTVEEITALFKEVLIGGGDETDEGRINKALRAQAVSLGMDGLKKLWKTVKKELESAKAAADAAAHEKRDAKAKAELEAKRDAKKKSPPPFVPLEDATVDTVNAAADEALWLPGFVHYEDGWFFETNFEEKHKSKPICRAFEVPYVAFGETEEGRTNEITIRYPHRSAQQGVVESIYKIGDTYRETGSFISRLADEGLEFQAQCKVETIVTLLRSVNTDYEAVLLQKAGWHGDMFMSPSGVAIGGGDVRYILHPSKRVSDNVKGTLAQHHAAATTALNGKNGARFMPGYLSGAVGCLADFIENDMSPILMNEGTANRGKTTALKAGAAWFAPADHTGLFLKADSTPTAIENFAERAQGSVLALDEDGGSKADADEKQRMVLQWAEGSGRNRATAESSVRRTKTWRTCFTTSSERGFLNVLMAADSDIRTGAVSRIFTVNYDAAVILNKKDDAAELAAYEVLAKGCYGMAGPVFAAKLVELGRGEVAARVSEMMDKWSDESKGAGTRVVRLAALFTVAGEIAQEAGLFGDDVPVHNHMDMLLRETLDARATHLDTEQQTLNTLRRSIIRALQTKRIIEKDGEPEYNRDEIQGYWEMPSDKDSYAGLEGDSLLRLRTYILPLDRLGKLVKADAKTVAAELTNEGALISRKKGGRDVPFHDYIPGEGAGQNLRVQGAFVHALADADEPDGGKKD